MTPQIFPYGTPLNIVWQFANADGTTFNIAGYTYRLFHRVGNNETEVNSSQVTASGDTLSFIFPADDTCAPGTYSVRLVLFQNGSHLCTINYNSAFVLSRLASGQTRQDQNLENNIVHLFTVAEYYLHTSVIPTVGDDGYWYVNGQIVIDGQGNYVSATHTMRYDPETKYLIIDEGRVDAHGESIQQTITDVATALADWDSQYTQAEGARDRAYGTAEDGRDTRYGQAESERGTRYAGAEGSKNGSAAGDGSRWGTFKTNEASRDQEVQEAISHFDDTKADKDADAVAGNAAKFDSNGNPVDGGTAFSTIVNGAAAGATAYQKPQDGIPASDIADGVIPDVSQFITKSVNDLVNYYLKSDTYTRAEVQQLIDAVKQFTYEVVAELPTASAATMNKIYLVPSSNPDTQNVKDEFITIRSGEEGSYIYSWEQIGSTTIDLSNYYTKAQTDTAISAALSTALADYTTTADLTTLLSGKVDKVAGKGLSTNDYTNEDKTKLGGVEASAQENVIETVKVNGTALTPAEKAVDIAVPTALSQLGEDTSHRVVTDTEKAAWGAKYDKPSGGIPATDIAAGVIPDVSQFITKNVSDLVNYYLKTDTFTKAEVEALISAITALIPTAATASNQLADKAFVNSSISTATATHRGTFNLVSDLGLTTSATEQQIAAALATEIATADNNDYAFVQVPTSDATPTQIARVDRYKYNGTAWAYEYTLNNSGYTAAQWAAINSAITSELVAKLSALPTSAELNTALGGKVDKVAGKGLSTEDYTTAEKGKLGDLPTNSELTTALGNKADKDTDAVEGHLAKFDANGNPVDGDIAINNVAQKDGSYDQMQVGVAKDLASSQSVPAEIVFRNTGGSTSVGKGGTAIIDRIKGKSRAWNQFLKNGDFSDNTGWSANNSTLAVSGGVGVMTALLAGAQSIYRTLKTPVVGHKYLLIYTLKADAPMSAGCGYGGNYVTSAWSVTTSWQKYSKVLSVNSTDSYVYVYGFWTDTSVKLYAKELQIFDLTLLYGSEIDGMTDAEILAKFESEYPGYHDYDEGTLISNDAESLETVGFNQFDESTWVVGKYRDAAGIESDIAGRRRSDVYFPCFPSTQYYFGYSVQNVLWAVVVCWYDANKNFISGTAAGNSIETSPANAAFFKISGADHITGDTCINLSDPAKNGTYEPYWKSVMWLGLDSFKVKSHNIWDEEWEVGEIADNALNSKNFISVSPSTTYYFKTPENNVIFYYDANHNQISIGEAQNTTFTTPANCAFIKFRMSTNYGTTYNHDICINLSSSFNGQYEPHGILTFTGGLKGVGNVRDEIVGGKYVDKLLKVDLGALVWDKYDGVFHAGISGSKQITLATMYEAAITAKYPWSVNSWISIPEKSFGFGEEVTGGGYGSIYIKDSSYNSADAIKAALSGVYAYVERSAPIEYELVEALPTEYRVDSHGTERRLPEDTASSVHAPFCAEITYSTNIKETVENLPKNYINVDSMHAFLAALGTAMNGEWDMRQGNGRFIFTFTPNTPTNENE